MGTQIDGQGIRAFDNTHRKTCIQTRKSFLENTSQQTAYAIQRRFQWDGIAAMILPIRVDV